MHIPRFAWVLTLLVVALVLAGFAPPAQNNTITLTVNPGFDGRFRDGEWLPVLIQVSSSASNDVQGRLVVRPETSGTGITNTYSVPVTLPGGARQSAALYITARGFATQARVELIDDAGNVLASQEAQLRAIQPLDRLYVVVSGSTAGSVDLTGAALDGYNAYQSNWQIEDIPDRAPALAAVDMLLLSDIDTNTLTTAQRGALLDWVAGGGHLLVTGGAGWQQTAAGLADLLPLVPKGSQAVDNLEALAAWLYDDAPLDAPAIVTTGDLQPGARTLVALEPAAGGIPLLIRRVVGAGVVDYLAADPNDAPLRGWDGLTRIWYTLITTREPKPSWSHGFVNWDMATAAVEILPGFNTLPDVLPLCGFLAAYIALIGPLNYLVLARLNRREYAWFTIPLFIVVFSALAWAVGFNLRGTEATLSRLSVVRAWDDVEVARVDGLIGLLSPRRAQYTLALENGGTLRPIPPAQQTGSSIISGTRSSVEIQQSDVFRAADFSVDASFIAGFAASGSVAKPAISGTVSVAFDGDTGQQTVRGSVRNDSDQTLQNPVILARGVALRLKDTFAPGDVEVFDLTLPGEGPPAPGIFSPTVGSASFVYSPYYSPYYYGTPGSGQTIFDILGQNKGVYDPYGQYTDPQTQEMRRRAMFLASFMYDYFTYTTNNSIASTGRGDSIFLAGWTDQAPLPITLEGVNWRGQDTTLYLIELKAEYGRPARMVTITADQFTWVTEAHTTMGDIAPQNITLQPGEEVVFRFTPLASAALTEVDRLFVNVERPGMSASFPVELYNWGADQWEQFEIEGARGTIRDPIRFIGAANAVLVRLNANIVGGYLRIDQISIEQRGSF